MTVKVTSKVVSRLSQLEKQVNKSGDQMEVLLRRISGLHIHHKRTHQNGHGPPRRSLQLELSVLEGVYAAYYTYTERQAQKLATMHTDSNAAGILNLLTTQWLFSEPSHHPKRFHKAVRFISSIVIIFTKRSNLQFHI